MFLSLQRLKPPLHVKTNVPVGFSGLNPPQKKPVIKPDTHGQK